MIPSVEMSVTGRNAKQRLVSLAVDEVSLVDHPAIVETFVVIKNEEPTMKTPESTPPAGATPTPAVQPTPGSVQAVVEQVKVPAETIATFKSASKTLADSLAAVSGKTVTKAKPKFDHIVATAKAKLAELEVEKAALPPEMEGMHLLAQAQISKLHGCLYDLEMMVASLMAMAESDEASEPAEKSAPVVVAPVTTPAAPLAATTPVVPPAPVAKGRVLTEEEAAKVKAAIAKAMEGLENVVHGVDPEAFLVLVQGAMAALPPMGAPQYSADVQALVKAAIEEATASLKKSLTDAQKDAADAKARVEKLESATGAPKSIPEGGPADTPVVKKKGLWTGVL
jgi:hypothetical protein